MRIKKVFRLIFIIAEILCSTSKPLFADIINHLGYVVLRGERDEKELFHVEERKTLNSLR